MIAKYKKVVVCELNGGQFATILRTKVPGKSIFSTTKFKDSLSSAELEEHISSLLK